MSLIPCSQIMIFLLCFQMAKNRERKPILLQYYIIMFFHSQGLCQWPHLIIIVFCCLCLISLVKWKFHHIGTWHTHYVYSINQVFMLYTIDWPIDFGLENFINELLQKKKNQTTLILLLNIFLKRGTFGILRDYPSFCI